jgi:SRSO17 transposase
VPDDISGWPKRQIVLDEIGRLRNQGLRFGCVLGDAEYGKVAAFHHALDARSLRWALGLPPTQKVFAANVTTAMPTPTKAEGRPRKHLVPSAPSRPAAVLFAFRPSAGAKSSRQPSPA